MELLLHQNGKASFGEGCSKVTRELKVEGFGISDRNRCQRDPEEKIEWWIFDGTTSWKPATPRLRTRH